MIIGPDTTSLEGSCPIIQSKRLISAHAQPNFQVTLSNKTLFALSLNLKSVEIHNIPYVSEMSEFFQLVSVAHFIFLFLLICPVMLQMRKTFKFKRQYITNGVC